MDLATAIWTSCAPLVGHKTELRTTIKVTLIFANAYGVVDK